MDILDYWTPEDALAFRCTIAQVGTLKPAVSDSSPDSPRADVDLARAYAPRAMRALARIMENGDNRAAVEAAREILLRAYGPALPQVPAPAPVAPVDTPPPTPDHPPWLTAQRHAYKAPDYAGQPAGNGVGALSMRETE